MPVKRKVGRPRKPVMSKRLRAAAAIVRRRRQAGGQLGALMPIVKFLGPLLLGEVAKLGIGAVSKKIRGKGLSPAGAGLKLAGAGHKRRRKPGPKKRRKRRSGRPPIRTLPFIPRGALML